MSTEMPARTQNHGPLRRRDRPASGQDRWWRRVPLAVGAVAVVATAGMLLPGVLWPQESDSNLTHTVTRGNLVVSVTEHGTLESSNNTEIKCKVRTAATPILWIVESGTQVQPGDELVRLGTFEFEDRIAMVSRWVFESKSAAERSKADVARAELAVSEYEEGRYLSELMTFEKDLAIAESNLREAREALGYVEKMKERNYISEMDVEAKEAAVSQAQLNVEVKTTEIDVLKRFTKAMEQKTLRGDLEAAKARHQADLKRVHQSTQQLQLCEADLANCFVKAEKSGLVIYPTTEPWKRVPEIEVGANVYMSQTMLVMPDFSKMQVKVGMPEAVVDRIKPGLDARVAVQDKILKGRVATVASVTAPTSKWTGNIVTYDTTIAVPSGKGLKPGLSAEVEVIIARYEDVLTVPVAALVETSKGDFCWVKTSGGVRKRALKLGDTNEVFTIVEDGLTQGDEVMLNPLAFMDEAEIKLLNLGDEAEPIEPESAEAGAESKSGEIEPDAEPEQTSPKPSKGTSGSGKPKNTTPKAA